MSVFGSCVYQTKPVVQPKMSKWHVLVQRNSFFRVPQVQRSPFQSQHSEALLSPCREEAGEEIQGAPGDPHLSPYHSLPLGVWLQPQDPVTSRVSYSWRLHSTTQRRKQPDWSNMVSRVKTLPSSPPAPSCARPAHLIIGDSFWSG